MGIIPIVCDYADGHLDGVPDDFDYVLHVAAGHQSRKHRRRRAPECGRHRPALPPSAQGPGLDRHGVCHHGRLLTTPTPDPWYRYKETDRLGGSTRVTKPVRLRNQQVRR